MNKVLFSKIQRLKGEYKFLSDSKSRFLSELKESIEVRKVVERSVYLLAEIVLDRKISSLWIGRYRLFPKID